MKYYIYILPNYVREGEGPYVGKSKSPRTRVYHHKHIGRDTSEWFILDECETNEEALAKEAAYHAQGFGGRTNEENVGRGGVSPTKRGSWTSFQHVDRKKVHIKHSKDRQVVIDALNEWNKEHGREPYNENWKKKFKH